MKRAILLIVFGLLVMQGVYAVPSTNPLDYLFYDTMETSGNFATFYTNGESRLGYSTAYAYNGTYSLRINETVDATQTAAINQSALNTSTAFCVDYYFYYPVAAATNSECIGVSMTNTSGASWPNFYDGSEVCLNTYISAGPVSGVVSPIWTSIKAASAGNWQYLKTCFDTGYASSGTTNMVIYSNDTNILSNQTVQKNSLQKFLIVGFGNGQAARQVYLDNIRVWNKAVNGILPPNASTTNTITLTLSNVVNGSSIGASTTFQGVTGTLAFTYFNITSTGFCVSYTGNGTGTNCTSSGSGASTYYNVTNTTSITGTQSVTAVTYQALLNVSATKAFTGASIASFNATNGLLTNSTTSGSVTLRVNNGTSTTTVNVSGNYTTTFSCTAASLTMSQCVVTGVYDNRFNITGVDGETGAVVTNFTVNATSSIGSHTGVQSVNNVSTLNLSQGYAWTFTIDAVGYAITNATLSANASTNTYQFNLSPSNSVYVYAYSQDTGLSLSGTNVTVTMQKNTTYLNTTSSTGRFLFQGLDPGNWTVTVTSSGYSTSTYYLTVTNRSTQTLNAYLAQTATSVIFVVKDIVTGDTISGGTLTIQNQVGGNWVTVDQAITDAFGQAGFSLIPLHDYQFIMTATNYTTKTGLVNTFITSYTILLNANNTQNFISYGDDFTYKTSPEQVSANMTTFSIVTSSPQGALQWFAVVVTYNGSTSTQNVTGSPSGGTASVTLNLTGVTGAKTVSATYYVQSVNINEPLVIPRSWLLYGGYATSNYTLVDFVDYYGSSSSPIDMTTRGILVTIVVAVLAATAGFFLGAAPAIIVAAIVFTLAGVFGWLGVGITVITVGALLGLLALGGRT